MEEFLSSDYEQIGMDHFALPGDELAVAAREGRLAGPAIDKACSAVQLVAGDMSIYHRHDGASGQVLFSLNVDGSIEGDASGVPVPGAMPGSRTSMSTER